MDLGDGQHEGGGGLQEDQRLAGHGGQRGQGAYTGKAAAEPTAAPLAITAAR